VDDCSTLPGMKNLILFLALCLSVLTLSAASQPQKTWEYKFEYKCTDKKANEFAAEGWELTGFSSTSYSGLSMMTCAFKRLK
jgi:hypothetical protein